MRRRSPTACRPPTRPRPSWRVANQRVEEQLSAARDDAAKRLADAERLAQQMVEEAKSRASEEGAKIIAAAKAEAEQEAVKAREALREQVAALAVQGRRSRSCAARSTPACTPSCWAA